MDLSTVRSTSLLLLALVGSPFIAPAGALPITFTYNMAGVINGTPLTFNASGVGDPSLGTLGLTMHYSAQPSNWDLLATYIAHSGSGELEVVRGTDHGFGAGLNLFTLTDGNFTLNRTTTYTDALTNATIGVLTFIGESTRTSVDAIALTGTIFGMGDWAGRIATSVLPYDYLWTPAGAGQLETHTDIPYETSTGLVMAAMDSLYSFDPTVQLLSSQMSHSAHNLVRVDPLTLQTNFIGEVFAIPEPTTGLLVSTAVLVMFGSRRVVRMHLSRN